jgi:hypothetical protein
VLSGALLALLACSACGEDEPDGPGQNNTASRRRSPIAVTPERAAEVAREQDRVAPARRPPPPPDPYANPEANAKQEEAPQAEAAKAEKPRDYPAELLAAMRGTESCVKPRTASESLPSELTISLEALVLESGTVVSGTARASVLTPEEIECVKRRLQSTHLPADVKEAPRRVNAALKLTFKKEAPAANAGGAPAPKAD